MYSPSSIQDLIYEGFYDDFGPLNLSKIWKYTTEVSKILSDNTHKDHIFYHQSSSDHRKHCNAALLICAFQVLRGETLDDRPKENCVGSLLTHEKIKFISVQRCGKRNMHLQMHSFGLPPRAIVRHEIRVV